MNIYQHFRPEEREFIDQVMQWKNYVDANYAPKLTDFLDPREQHILKMLVGEHGDVRYQLFGGYEKAERKRAILLPDYLTANQDDFLLCLLEVDYPVKFVTIEHPQVLGSLMSLGVKRGKFGDILVNEGRVQFFAANEIMEYIMNNLESIGRSGVKVKPLSLDEAVIPSEMWAEAEMTVSSLRLDTVISGVHHLSRQKSQLLIQQGVVKVNWTPIENPAFECAEGDLLSVRSHGRAKILSIEGKTKKDKWRIHVGKQK